jgi:hypothetical protein
MTRSISKKVLLACSSFLFVLSASAGDLTTPNTFTAGTAAVAAEVNENFAAVEVAVDDNDARISGLQGDVSTADATTFFLPDDTPAAGDVVGTGTLTRTAQGANFVINTTMLDADSAYTLWWIIFNNPAACDPAGCSGPDLGMPAVEGSVMNATGRVADANGNATFSAFVPVGFMHTNPASGNLRQVFGPGLQDVWGAEIHVVIRSHGPATGNVEQISTLLGDCVNEASPTGCYDGQAVAFPLPSP